MSSSVTGCGRLGPPFWPLMAPGAARRCRGPRRGDRRSGSGLPVDVTRRGGGLSTCAWLPGTRPRLPRRSPRDRAPLAAPRRPREAEDRGPSTGFAVRRGRDRASKRASAAHLAVQAVWIVAAMTEADYGGDRVPAAGGRPASPRHLGKPMPEGTPAGGSDVGAGGLCAGRDTGQSDLTCTATAVPVVVLAPSFRWRTPAGAAAPGWGLVRAPRRPLKPVTAPTGFRRVADPAPATGRSSYASLPGTAFHPGGCRRPSRAGRRRWRATLPADLLLHRRVRRDPAELGLPPHIRVERYAPVGGAGPRRCRLRHPRGPGGDWGSNGHGVPRGGALPRGRPAGPTPPASSALGAGRASTPSPPPGRFRQRCRCASSATGPSEGGRRLRDECRCPGTTGGGRRRPLVKLAGGGVGDDRVVGGLRRRRCTVGRAWAGATTPSPSPRPTGGLTSSSASSTGDPVDGA